MTRRSAVGEALLRPELAGAAYLVALVAYGAIRAAADSRLLGVDAREVTELISARFADEVRRSAILLVALAAAAGVLVGAVASVLVHLRRLLRGEPPPSPLRHLARAVPVLVAVHAAIVFVSMARRPQLYEQSFYDRGGIERFVEVVATDVLGLRGTIVLVAVAVLAFLAPPRRLFSSALRRLLRIAPIAAALAACLVVARLGAIAVARHARAFARGPRPNVLILAADSLRRDRIVPRTAPALSAFAAGATSFDRTYVSLPRTFPSWVTLLTGRHPHHHGIRNMFPSRRDRAKDFDALPERLAAAGYFTAVVSDYAGDVFPRIDLGFARIDTPTFDFGELIRQRAIEPEIALLPFLDTRLGRALVSTMRGMNSAPDADLVADHALDAIDASGGRPFFVVAFFSNAHFPYASPSPGYARFTDPAYRGRFKYEKRNRLGREAPPDEADVRQIRALYDGAVSTIDDAARRILDGLHERDLDSSTIVIVTADHGETLFENGRGHGHGDHLFGEEALRVPLLVRDGRNPGARAVRDVARDVDLAATLYELTGVAAPADLDGRSLVPALRGDAMPDVPAFAETGLWFTEDAISPALRLPYPDISRMTEVLRDAGDDVVLQDRYFALTVMAKHRAIISGRQKLVLAPTRAGLLPMLFDVETDPGCTNDLSRALPDVTADLRAKLLAWILEDRTLELRGPHLVPRASAIASASAENTVRLEATP